MKNETKMKREIDEMRNQSFKEIEAILNKYEYDFQDMIASFVASLCNVDVADMLSVTNNTAISQARWLYWYSIRYFTHDTYQRISDRSRLDGHVFAKDGIGISITKMNNLIETDNVWKRRWMMVKRLIRLMQDPHDYNVSDFCNPSPQKYKILLQVPQGTKENFDVEIVENRNK